jgi:hypothetical protein
MAPIKVLRRIGVSEPRDTRHQSQWGGHRPGTRRAMYTARARVCWT